MVQARGGRGGGAAARTPNIRITNGGLDANWMVRHGIPTVTFGAGQNEAHTVDEWINLDEFERALRAGGAAGDDAVRRPARVTPAPARRSSAARGRSGSRAR